MLRENIKTTSNCIFCKYWDGARAQRAKQPNYWEFTNCKGNCMKKRLDNVFASHKCNEFELDTYVYYN